MAPAGLVGHDDIDALVMRLRLGTDASELHGSLCGYLAGGGSLRGTSVLAALQLDGEVTDPSADDLAVLDRLARQTETELREIGHPAHASMCDLGDPMAIAHYIDAAAAALGHLRMFWGPDGRRR